MRPWIIAALLVGIGIGGCNKPAPTQAIDPAAAPRASGTTSPARPPVDPAPGEGGAPTASGTPAPTAPGSAPPAGGAARGTPDANRAPWDIDLKDGQTTSYDTPEGKVTATRHGDTTRFRRADGAEFQVTKGDANTAEQLGLPLYPGAQQIQAMTGSDSELGSGGGVLLSSADPPGKVVEFYRGKMRNPIVAQAPAGGTTTVAENDPSAPKFMAQIGTGEDGKTQILLFIAKTPH